MNKGWIKLYRKIQYSNMYKSLTSKQRDVMMQCLLLANHDENTWEWGSEIFQCKSGQFITSLDKLKNLCANDVKVQSVRTSLLKLENWHFLTNKSTKTGRLITICNWGSYQDPENETNKDIDKDLTKSQQSSNKELTTNKKIKNKKNDKEEIFIKIIDYLNMKLDKHYKHTSEATRKHISARLNDGFTEEDFKKVIDNKVADWINDSKMSEFLRPNTLFGNKFEGYLNSVKKNFIETTNADSEIHEDETL